MSIKRKRSPRPWEQAGAAAEEAAAEIQAVIFSCLFGAGRRALPVELWAGRGHASSPSREQHVAFLLRPGEEETFQQTILPENTRVTFFFFLIITSK